jgi:hypothetical protein
MGEQAEYIEVREDSRERGLGSRLLRFLLRFLVVLTIGAGIGVAAYFGVPALYRDFIEPVQSHSDRIAALEETLALTQVDFRKRDTEITSDLVQIEGELAQQQEDLSELMAGTDGLTSQIEEVENNVEATQRWSTRLEDLEERHLALEARFVSLEESLVEDDDPYTRLEVQIQLLRVMELVTRARYWMVQGNLGEASDDLEVAKGILESIRVENMDEEALLLIINRLDQVLAEISLNPIIAADDLEIVWQLLLLATEP